jgi:hypothetical protein
VAPDTAYRWNAAGFQLLHQIFQMAVSELPKSACLLWLQASQTGPSPSQNNATDRSLFNTNGPEYAPFMFQQYEGLRMLLA